MEERKIISTFCASFIRMSLILCADPNIKNDFLSLKFK